MGPSRALWSQGVTLFRDWEEKRDRSFAYHHYMVSRPPINRGVLRSTWGAGWQEGVIPCNGGRQMNGLVFHLNHGHCDHKAWHCSAIEKKNKTVHLPTTITWYHALLSTGPPVEKLLQAFPTARCLLKVHIFWEGHKFCEIFTLLWTVYVCTAVKSKVKILQNFVAFSEYMKFNTF